MDRNGKTAVRFAITAAACMLVFFVPETCPDNSGTDLIRAICAAFALVSMAGVVLTGPIWSKIVAAILALPPLLFLVMIFKDVLYGG